MVLIFILNSVFSDEKLILSLLHLLIAIFLFAIIFTVEQKFWVLF